MEHSFHRKAFINSSRFGPLRIEVNQSEILENYNTFITQHAQPSKITFYQVIFWIQGAHANYFWSQAVYCGLFGLNGIGGLLRIRRKLWFSY